MQVLKFGGASVKDANSVKNLLKILKTKDYKNCLVVISAMGKMTNAFENLTNHYYNQKSTQKPFNFIREYHYNIVENLFKDKDNFIFFEIEKLFGQLSFFLATNKSKNYNFIYDQIVSFGELLSTTIVSHYLNNNNIKNKWLDVRAYIKTNSDYRAARVNWQLSEKNITQLKTNKLYITQGFLGQDEKQKTTTLGREGSDYTAAVFAYCLNAKSVTIWKDVEGVLNADPRYFNTTTLLQQISYNEAIEMAFYGASVIHPKTIKPLENKEIPLYVRSFTNTKNKGTSITKEKVIIPKTACFIVKKNQILLNISTKDFSFIVEHHISNIFKELSVHKQKVNLIQNSALSFSVCVEDKFNYFDDFLKKIQKKHHVTYYQNVSLYTVRHATKQAITNIEQKGKVLLKQAMQQTVQLIIE